MRALIARYPGLARLPHADLGVRETPLERWTVAGTTLLVKRDDLSANHVGGNKVRALEPLLGAVPAGHRLLTVGSTGSTHALAVARHAARLGLRTDVITWPQEEHAIARATARAMAEAARVTHGGSVGEAYLRAFARRLRGGVHWIPAGGSTPLGVLGHASAALELARQLGEDGVGTASRRERDDVPFSRAVDSQLLTERDPGPTPAPPRPPLVVVAPLGSGGTVAGLMVGLALAGLSIPVVGVQVVPRVVARRAHVLRLARRTHALIARYAGVALPALDVDNLVIERGAYGGAYGRETAGGREAARLLEGAGGPMLDPTYSAKAFAVALERARSSPDGTVVFWLTFDGRWLR